MSCDESIPPSASSQPETIAGLTQRVVALERNHKVQRQVLGSAPDVITGREGEGLVRAFLDLRGDFKVLGGRLDALAKVFEEDIRSRKAEAEAKAQKIAPWSKAAWIAIASAIGVVTSSGVGGVVYWLTHR